MRDRIFNTLDDVVSTFLYYDRKEDEYLPMEAIEKAIANKEISIDEIAAFFKAKLIQGLTDKGNTTIDIKDISECRI